MPKMRAVLIMLFIAAALGCVGGDDDGQDFGNIFESPEGVILTEEEHPDGWGRTNCFACHPVEEIHRENRTGTEGILPLEDIQEFVEEEGLDSCPVCHGDNGVEE
ncbi:MAG: hypothetical protein V3U74_05870 [Thermodesulfobacteriota bacterium]